MAAKTVNKILDTCMFFMRSVLKVGETKLFFLCRDYTFLLR